MQYIRVFIYLYDSAQLLIQLQKCHIHLMCPDVQYLYDGLFAFPSQSLLAQSIFTIFHVAPIIHNYLFSSLNASIIAQQNRAHYHEWVVTCAIEIRKSHVIHIIYIIQISPYTTHIKKIPELISLSLQDVPSFTTGPTFSDARKPI